MKAVLLNRILLILAVAGLFVAGVLSLDHLPGFEVPCGGSSDCARVAAHPASKLFGVPVAYFGFATYLVLAIVASIRAAKGMRNVGSLIVGGYVIAAVGTVFSIYLQYQSFDVIKAACPWCMTSAVIMIALLVGHAALSHVAEKAPLAEDTGAAPIDSVLIIGLPLAFVLALAITGVTMRGQRANVNPIASERGLPSNLREIVLTDADNAIGPEKAPITVVEFADLQCGACMTSSPMIKAFAEEHPEKIRLVFRHFPLSQHQWAAPAAVVSEYAAEKGKFWEFIMAVMQLKRELDGPDELYGIAQQVGLDVNDLQKRIADAQDPMHARVARDMEAADKVGLRMTPTFFILAEGMEPEVANSNNVFDKLTSEKYRKILNE